MKPPAFQYLRPTSLSEAVDMLASAGEDAKVLAGGQSLVPMLNFRLLKPTALIDINRISELDFIHEDEAGLRESMAAVHRLIAAEVARGVPARRIVLAGFSQGCAITLGAGVRCTERLAGLAGLSGYVPLADTTAAERHSANRDTPVFLAHGRNDGVVAMARGTAGRDLLQGLGQPLEWHDYPMEHSVCIEEVQALQQWLLRVLATN